MGYVMRTAWKKIEQIAEAGAVPAPAKAVVVGLGAWHTPQHILAVQGHCLRA